MQNHRDCQYLFLKKLKENLLVLYYIFRLGGGQDSGTYEIRKVPRNPAGSREEGRDWIGLTQKYRLSYNF